MLLPQLEESVRLCRKCPELAGKHVPLFGEGSTEPGGIVIIGDAPNEDEVKEGRPAVGRCGKLLRNAIRDAGFSDLPYYITNILKCRPPDNRDPSPQEMGHCWQHLEQQLLLLNPKLIITLGSVSTGMLQEKPTASVPIMRIAGQTYQARGFSCIPLVHPEHILRRRRDRDLGLSFIGHLRIALGHYERICHARQRVQEGS